MEGDAGGGFRGSLARGEVHLQGEIVAGRVAEHADLGALGVCNLLQFGAGSRLGPVAAVHEHRMILDWKGFVHVGGWDVLMCPLVESRLDDDAFAGVHVAHGDANHRGVWLDDDVVAKIVERSGWAGGGLGSDDFRHLSFLLFGTIAVCNVSASCWRVNSIYQENFFYFFGDLLLTDSNGCSIMRGGTFFYYYFLFFS